MGDGGEGCGVWQCLSLLRCFVYCKTSGYMRRSFVSFQL